MQKPRKFGAVYCDLLDKLLHSPDFVASPRGMEVRELYADAPMFIEPSWTFFNNEARPLSKLIKYFIGETLWYFGGRRDLAFIKKFSKFWEKIANPDGTCNSAYGDLIFSKQDAIIDMLNCSQWHWAYSSLVKDKHTRQAVMHFNRPNHQYSTNKDFVCTMYCNFHIRGNKLYLISRMRSQDVVKGLTYDLPFFDLLGQNMAMLLRGSGIGVEFGGTFHTSDSLHLYKSDYELAEKMLQHEFVEERCRICRPLVNCSGKPDKHYDTLMKMYKDADPDDQSVYQQMFDELRS